MSIEVTIVKYRYARSVYCAGQQTKKETTVISFHKHQLIGYRPKQLNTLTDKWNIVIGKTIGEAREGLLGIDSALAKRGISQGIPDLTNPFWMQGCLLIDGILTDFPEVDSLSVARYLLQQMIRDLGRFDCDCVIKSSDWSPPVKNLPEMKIRPSHPRVVVSRNGAVDVYGFPEKSYLMINQREIAELAASRFRHEFGDELAAKALEQFANTLPDQLACLKKIRELTEKVGTLRDIASMSATVIKREVPKLLV